jgi:hypothetical protein
MNKRRRYKAKAHRRATLMVDHVLQRIRQADTQRMSIKTYADLNRLMRETGYQLRRADERDPRLPSGTEQGR